MASLAGMLKQRGFRVTGSDAAAYPPMSVFLGEMGIPVAQPFDPRNLTPRPDLVIVGNAISRGNAELDHLLDERIPFCSLPKFLHYFPDSVILTSVEFDHADIYKDLDAVETAFKRLVNLVPRRGRIVAFDSGESVERCISRAFCPVERYGSAAKSDWQVANL